MREKLADYNTVEDVVNLIRKSQRIVILTGAGISWVATRARAISHSYAADIIGVSCGIPDFRSRDGLYASLKETGEYDLDDPQQMYRPASHDSQGLPINLSLSGSTYNILERIQLVSYFYSLNIWCLAPADFAASVLVRAFLG